MTRYSFRHWDLYKPNKCVFRHLIDFKDFKLAVWQDENLALSFKNREIFDWLPRENFDFKQVMMRFPLFGKILSNSFSFGSRCKRAPFDYLAGLIEVRDAIRPPINSPNDAIKFKKVTYDFFANSIMPAVFVYFFFFAQKYGCCSQDFV